MLKVERFEARLFIPLVDDRQKHELICKFTLHTVEQEKGWKKWTPIRKKKKENANEKHLTISFWLLLLLLGRNGFTKRINATVGDIDSKVAEGRR